MSTPVPDDQISVLSEMLFAGRKIEAIKQYRELTGLGLKESKDGVEELESSLRRQYPDKFKAPVRRGGCLGPAVFLACGAAVFAYWITHR